VKLVECPRDAMQGLHDFIPTETKIAYINQLLKVGFDTIDFGSFVSSKAIPQLADTSRVLEKLDLDNSKSKLLSIVGNERGTEDALAHDEISFIGFPFSISEEFLKRNINSNIKDSIQRLGNISNLVKKRDKKLVVYISMAFGKPYDEDWSPYIVAHWVERLIERFDIDVLSLSDTIGSSNKASISYLFSKVIPEFPKVEIGAHLHTTPDTWLEKVEAAYENGCRRFDGALMGFGGCPMAKDELTGNMPTENMISYFSSKNIDLGLNQEALKESMRMANEIFTKYH